MALCSRPCPCVHDECMKAGDSAQSDIQSLPRELSLPADGVLRIKPLRELKKLRYDDKDEGDITVKSDSSHILKDIYGDTVAVSYTHLTLPTTPYV